MPRKLLLLDLDETLTMRMHRTLFGLIAALLTVPALADYSACLDAQDPPDCIARRAIRSLGLSAGDTLEVVLRHGLVDLVPRKSAKLMRGLYENIGKPDATMSSPEEQLLDSSAAAALRKAPRRSVIAAMALAAAARYERNPFGDPTVLALEATAKADPRIPAYALALWFEVVAMSGVPPDFRSTPEGLAKLWERAMARRDSDADMLLDIAGTPAFVDRLPVEMRQFLLWYAGRSGLTPLQRVEAASPLARHFGLFEEAAGLLKDVSDSVEGYDVPGVRVEVADARLAHGYDTDAARLVTAAISDGFLRNGTRYEFFSNDRERDALERAGAHDELRSLAAECLRRAAAEEGGPAAANWFAAASDLLLRAGDIERAREVARLGLPYVARIVREGAAIYSNVDQTSPTAMASAVQGRGTSPVVALYRTGAIDEALKTGYLTGKDRYFNAERAGEPRDPQWTIDHGWSLYIEVMAVDAEASKDRAFQQRAYDGLVRMCGKPIADCFDETLRTIAQVAAGMGDEARMKEALSAATRQLDTTPRSVRAFSAMYVAGPWAHCKDVLRAAQMRLSSQHE
jgi:hypothetical protein